MVRWEIICYFEGACYQKTKKNSWSTKWRKQRTKTWTTNRRGASTYIELNDVKYLKRSWTSMFKLFSSPSSQQIPTTDLTPTTPSFTTLLQRAPTSISVTSGSANAFSSHKNSTSDASSSTNISDVTHTSTAVFTAPTEAPTAAGKEALVIFVCSHMSCLHLLIRNS